MEYKELLEYGIATKDFVRTEIAGVRTEIAKMRTGIAGVRTGISDLCAEIKDRESRIIKWIAGTATAAVLFSLGILHLIGLNFQ